jgi:hypothetical protein
LYGEVWGPVVKNCWRFLTSPIPKVIASVKRRVSGEAVGTNEETWTKRSVVVGGQMMIWEEDEFMNVEIS